MKVIIYGFESNIQNHSIKEICFFLLIFAIMVLIMGRFAEKNSIKNCFSKVIRYGKIRVWWNRLWIKILFLALLEIGILFVFMGFVDWFAYWKLFEQGMVLPLLLWICGMCGIGVGQLLASVCQRYSHLFFACIVGFEILSIYGFSLFGKIVDCLPGSYVMLRRTTVLDGMMPLLAVFVIEIVVILMIGVLGHKLYKRSNC